MFAKKDILDIGSLDPAEISMILDTAEGMKEINERPVKKVPTLRGKTIVLFFQEPSTRTKLSFDTAAKRLSADSLSISQSTSSIVKGETLIDTAKNLEAMKPDVIVLRHPSSGAPHLIAKHVKASVINAGDGIHAHPSQALLDMMSVREKKGKIKGLKISIIGDISHSRVARSDITGFSKMGAKVRICAPQTMIPMGIEKLGCTIAPTMEACIEDADVVMMLRIQKERQGNILFPTEREYATLFGLNTHRLKLAKKDVLVMHPGPMNRGVEIASDVADSEYSIILEQVTNGVALRMALFYLLAGGNRHADAD
ncbi:MAG: aspartate carbamoyltransferase catalytic subunit [Proteobacteria bacterium]|nr:aspartate carbamoyltransferase catalytic subunit [Pseudomonadota bacterium]MBU1386975.1 aspartate carbamoyltransferase catalytic subunit [Pseudomonadota bacterium]MBU1542344.1 aspartate carbamoyltransferase catalytic subunit [Pseudomonadota bacterium]MBU2430066.1 aspartate carbamoyltransferase catalytic subunit [Pseudomonadota bacterium]MBU2481807.1 aspartate carbamoyltransferase catalytic subunit [Pseudomonadota bacterium]